MMDETESGKHDAPSEEPAITAETWPGSAVPGKKAKPKTKRARAKSKKTPAPRQRKVRKTPQYKSPWTGADLPERATSKAEHEWVHANMFDCRVEHQDGGVQIDYSKCTTDPPSRGALMLLTVAVNKPDDFQLKAMQAVMKKTIDPMELERRDKMQVAEIEAILEQFEEAGER